MCKNIIYKGKNEYVVETDGIEKPIGPNLLELIKCVYKNKSIELTGVLAYNSY